MGGFTVEGDEHGLLGPGRQSDVLGDRQVAVEGDLNADGAAGHGRDDDPAGIGRIGRAGNRDRRPGDRTIVGADFNAETGLLTGGEQRVQQCDEREHPDEYFTPPDCRLLRRQLPGHDSRAAARYEPAGSPLIRNGRVDARCARIEWESSLRSEARGAGEVELLGPAVGELDRLARFERALLPVGQRDVAT